VKNGLLSVNKVCRLFGISKKTYYQNQSTDFSLARKYSELKPKIIKIIQENPSYGYPRIKKALEEIYGEIVNHKLLLKLLKLWRLSLPRKIKKRKSNWIKNIIEYLGIKSNLLRSLILKGSMIKCFDVILSDITEICYSGQKAYLCIHMDYAGKYIYGWDLSANPDQVLVISSAKKAIITISRFSKRDVDGIIFHQDRGSVYTSEGYVSYLLKKEILISYSRKGEPGDNAVNESFFSRFKDEWLDSFSELKTYYELKNGIKKSIEYYNEKRYHSSIGYKTPLAYIKEHVHT
jgi:putative transposase